MIFILKVLFLILLCKLSLTKSNGLLLLYKPLDITDDCSYAHRLEYDISFGMGLSDTLTLVLRTLTERDYQCVIEIKTTHGVLMIVVIKYPTTIAENCEANADAVVMLKRDRCIQLCEIMEGRNRQSPFFVTVVRGTLKLHFVSNSSINNDINAKSYQITTTSARKITNEHNCGKGNETSCVIGNQRYCFTSGVLCDGIVNCGVLDWFDERKIFCGLPVQTLGIGPVIAVLAAVSCLLLATCHILLRCLPPPASSFFIFNANEDNRLCIDPVFTTPSGTPRSIETVRQNSLIPVFSSSSSNSDNKVVKLNIVRGSVIGEEREEIEENDSETVQAEESIDLEGASKAAFERKSVLKVWANKFQKRFTKHSN